MVLVQCSLVCALLISPAFSGGEKVDFNATGTCFIALVVFSRWHSELAAVLDYLNIVLTFIPVISAFTVSCSNLHSYAVILPMM